MPNISDQGSYDRGVMAGEISERLDNHEIRLNIINVSIKETSEHLQELTLAVQRLGDDAHARDATVISTAAALEAATKARVAAAKASEDQGKVAWGPVARVGSLLATMAAVAIVFLQLYIAFGV